MKSPIFHKISERNSFAMEIVAEENETDDSCGLSWAIDFNTCCGKLSNKERLEDKICVTLDELRVEDEAELIWTCW